MIAGDESLCEQSPNSVVGCTDLSVGDGAIAIIENYTIAYMPYGGMMPWR